MSGVGTVDPQISDAIQLAQKSVMPADVIQASGAGKAYQMVAQSCALAVQDATDTLRNMSTIADTASGVALTQYMETRDPACLSVIEEAHKLMMAARDNFAAVGEAAANLLKSFPSG